MILPILKEPDLRLHRRSLPVSQITQEIQKLIDTMIETMHAAEGVGLAANQIGSPLSILVASPQGAKGKELVLVNPRILKTIGRGVSPEGCLSLPGVQADVVRWSEVTVTGLDREGKSVMVKADGLLARILQHEVDHLEGHLFLYRLDFLKRWRLIRKYRKLTSALKDVSL